MSGSIGPVRNPSTSAQRAAPLFRGTGCHNCRTRKVKCDAGKPFCVRCIQHNSTDKCKYDKVKKSKLTLAKEEIASLKERLAQIERAEAGRSPPRFEPPVIEDIKEPPSSAFSQVTLEPDEDYDEQDEEEDDEVRDDPINIESGPHLVRPQHSARSEYYPMGPAQVPRLDHYSGPQPEGFEPAQFHPGQFQHHDPYQQAYQGPHYLQAPVNNFNVAGFAQRGDHVHSAPYTPQVQTTALPEVYSWPPTPSDPVPPSATTSGFTPSPMSSRWTRPLPPGSPSSSYPATNYPRGALFRDDGRYVGGAMESFNAYQGAPIQAPPAHRRPVPSPPIFGYDMILSYFQTWRAKNKPQTYLEYQYEQPRADGSWALVGNWWERDDLSVADRDRFLNLFMPYRKQAGFEVWMPDFLASLHNPPARRPHPGFMWAIYSCAAFFSGDPELLALLPAFMERARRNLEESFARSDRLFDYIRGQTLYASIMYMSGKTNEGAMAATAACHAAIVCGLHKIFSPMVVPQAQHQERSGYRIRQIDFHLEPATSPREHGERITAFWQLLLVDLSAAATTGVPPMFRDDGDERSRIETVFPRPLEEYMNGQAERVPYATLGDIFTSNAIPNPPDIVLTIQIKATALLERAVRLATKWPRGSHISTTDPVKYQDEYNTVVSAIQHFRTYIPSLRPQEGDFAESQLNLTVSGLIFEWIFPHFMLLNAQIRLYNMLEEEAARNLCLDSAYGISHLTSQLTDEEIPQLGVLLGHCFDAAEVVFEGALDSCQDHVRSEYQGHLDALKHAREVLATNHWLTAGRSAWADERIREFPVRYP